MRKIGLIALALVLALGSLGIGYALWWDTLYIDGTVETGYIQADWHLENVWDSEIPGKDVSWVEAEIIGDTLYVDIYNAYPSIWYLVNFDIWNNGTIPIHFGDFVIGQSDLPQSTDVFFDIFNSSGTVIPLSQVQLHPGWTIRGELWVHLNNDAEQNTTYSFSVDLDYWQYNEPGPP